MDVVIVPTFSITANITIQVCRVEDVRNLEWFGALTEYRHLIEHAFTRQQMSDVVMLNAMLNDFPIGQVWIDLYKQREQQIGVLWALRVLLPLQNLGIGTQLIGAAENVLRGRGFGWAELDVERDNIAAKRLYERLGYAAVGEFENRWSYLKPTSQTPDDAILNEERIEVVSHEWKMRKQL